MIRFLLILALVCSAHAAVPGRVQANFLIIVDTSVSMDSRKAGAIELVREAIASGFGGQIKSGDSIDLWTYDSENHIARFPPHLWEPSESGQIVANAVSFLQRERFRGRSRFLPVAADLTALLPHTRNLLALIITDAEEPISAVAFDVEINERLAEMKRRRSSRRQPFLVSLAAENGRVTNWAVASGEEELNLAVLPPRPEAEIASIVEQADTALEPAQEEAEPAEPEQPEPEPPPIVIEYPPGAKVVTAVPTPSAPSEALTGEMNVPPSSSPIDEDDLTVPVAASVTNAPAVGDGGADLTERSATPEIQPPRTEARSVALQEITPPDREAVGEKESGAARSSIQESGPMGSLTILLAGGGAFLCLSAGSLLLYRKGRTPPRHSIISKSLSR